MTSPFPLPVLFTAWTWHDGAGIAGEVIRRAKLGGFKTVAVQLSESTPDDGTDEGRTLDPQDVKFMKDAGLFVVGWDAVGSSTAHLLETLPLDGWLPQVEGPGQRDALFAALKAGVGHGLPKALVTTYGGLDTLWDVANLRAAWGATPFTFVECYKADGFPHDDIDRMLAQGAVYGFDRAALRALVGTYRGEMPADYTGLDAADYGGAYLEESMTDAQLKAFASLPAPPPPPPPPPPPVTIPDPATVNAKIAALADTWLSCFTDSKPLTRLRIIKRIAQTTDAEWVAAREDVKDALDGLVPRYAQMEAELAGAKETNSRLIAQNAELQRKIANAKTALG